MALNKIQNLTQAKTAVNSVLKKYRITWHELNQANALLAWRSLGGLWKGKRIPDAAKWQKKYAGNGTALFEAAICSSLTLTP
ncbi:MAG: hypothetical protein A3H72_02985 [Candidatus Doudnabacteria bacterium RIFCSPLOWO2_02_FULL_48_8]|uniref:Uncharacterized protein n=1 Tax=Candidatus Doudnabacteria bacterium RIFCSPHIGHO2_01_FULL_46_24 TaxID=1817825 RepID=A0A1F5NVC0_9BACT|nr:MAG: hypothetical protein A2720_00695 [Candidatus Doudnabacteria bacterium RIFCSPHIGHO2_01_FULL_46_24]OGE95642.1 MAG: hypothetical protein A3H72_02985 [Candidatus Doudnabacteria bacterium RIFCSPLOWO2_02_FULL_48_8]OGE95988.1 MAG: hypothetical protein A3E98_04155 [Candidatus Doudnabacteria bacterium RIFCSPHIGHO2_12_FULL_48_11]